MARPNALNALLRDQTGHGRLHQVVGREFGPERLDVLRPSVKQVANRLISRFVARGKAELMEEFAEPLPLTIRMELLGVPESDRENLRYWVDVPGRQDDGLGYLRDLVNHKTTHPGIIATADLLGRLCRDEGGPERLSDLELASLAWLLLVDYPVTADLIRAGVLGEDLAPPEDPVGLGLPLALTEARIAVEVLRERCRELTTGTPGPTSLPITFQAVTA
jgi:cytochrome P450